MSHKVWIHKANLDANQVERFNFKTFTEGAILLQRKTIKTYGRNHHTPFFLEDGDGRDRSSGRDELARATLWPSELP